VFDWAELISYDSTSQVVTGAFLRCYHAPMISCSLLKLWSICLLWRCCCFLILKSRVLRIKHTEEMRCYRSKMMKNWNRMSSYLKLLARFLIASTLIFITCSWNQRGLTCHKLEWGTVTGSLVHRPGWDHPLSEPVKVVSSSSRIDMHVLHYQLLWAVDIAIVTCNLQR